MYQTYLFNTILLFKNLIFYISILQFVWFYKNIIFSIIGAICMIYVYLGEFLTPDKRDSYLLLLEIFWVLGMILNPG